MFPYFVWILKFSISSIETECHFVFPVVYLYCWPVRATVALCRPKYVSYDSDVKILRFLDLWDKVSPLEQN